MIFSKYSQAKCLGSSFRTNKVWINLQEDTYNKVQIVMDWQRADNHNKTTRSWWRTGHLPEVLKKKNNSTKEYKMSCHCSNKEYKMPFIDTIDSLPIRSQERRRRPGLTARRRGHNGESKRQVMKYKVIHTLLKRYKIWTKVLIGIIEQRSLLKRSRRSKIQWVFKIHNNWCNSSHSCSNKVLNSLQMFIKTMNPILWMVWWIKELRKWITIRGISKAIWTTITWDRLRQTKTGWWWQAQTSGKGPPLFQLECQMGTNPLKIITSRAFKTTCKTSMENSIR